MKEIKTISKVLLLSTSLSLFAMDPSPCEKEAYLAGGFSFKQSKDLCADSGTSIKPATCATYAIAMRGFTADQAIQLCIGATSNKLIDCVYNLVYYDGNKLRDATEKCRAR